MRAVGKLLAFVLVLVFILVLPAAVLGYDIGSVIFDQPKITAITTEIVTKSDLIPLGLNWYSETQAERRYASGAAEAWVGEPDVVQLISFLDTDDWRAIRREVLTDEILAKWTASTVDGVYKWLDSQEKVPQITWTMADFVQRIESKHGLTAITIAYNALPPCTDEQIADFKSRLAAAPAGEKVLYNLCRFPDPWKTDQFGDYQDALEAVAQSIPARFNLTAELAPVSDPDHGVGAEAIRNQLLAVRRIMILAPIVVLFLLLLIAVLAVRSLRSLGFWWGIPLILGGLLVLAGGVVYRVVLTGVLSAGILSEVPPLIMKEALKGILILAGHIFKPMVWQGIVVLASGILLLVAGSVRRKKPGTAHDEPEAGDVP